jgi:small ligand-binding sensory domain FIST
VTAAGSGLVTGRPPADAALDASLQALEAAGGDRADIALVFVTGEAHRATHEMLHAVRRVTGAPVVVGCSGNGVLDGRREVEGESAVAVLVVRDERLLATPFLVENQEAAGAAAGARIAERVGGTVAEGGCLFVLPDVAGLDPRALLDGLQDSLGFVPVVGAVAAATEGVSGALAGVALSGLHPVIGVAQGCAPIGEPYVITRAAENVVIQIAGRRALDVLREAVQSAPGGPERAQRGGVFAGLALDPAKSPLERGDFLVRNLLGVDGASGAVAVGERVHVGQTIQFQVRDAEASREDLELTLDDVADRLGGRRPAFGCYFNCAGRGQGLYGVRDHDVALITGRLGSFPLVGFFGNGEFAPVGRRNVFHTYTGALVVFAG